MKEFAVFEAKARLSELLIEVEQGEQVLITRRGLPVARLVGLVDDDSAKRAAAASAINQRQQVGALIASLREQRKGVVLEGDLRALIAEGRD